MQELKNLGLKHLLLEEQLAFVPRLKAYMKPGSGYVEIHVEDSFVFSVTESRSVLEKLGFSGEIVATPGHSDDSMSLVLDEGIAFVGDLTPPLASDDLVRQSWDNLRRLNVTKFCTGHG